MKQRYAQISTTTFLNELLLGKNLSAPQLRKIGNLKDYNISGSQRSLLPPLCLLFNAVVKVAGVNAVFKDIAPRKVTAVAAYRLSEEALLKTQASESRKPHIARCAYPWMVTAMEVKRQGAETGFGFEPGEPLLREGDSAEEVRSRFSAYAAEIMLRQHRTHLYMFYIAGWRVRVFRWDRNGAVVSNPIDLRIDSKTVLNLIYRLVLGDGSTQGFDTTVALASEAEVDRLRAYDPDNVYLTQHKSAMLNTADRYPIYKVECDEVLQHDDRRRTRLSRRKRYLIGKHVGGGYATIGRSTRGWVAYNLDDEVMVFMKEQWRANTLELNPEFQTYLRLREHGVGYVATLVAGGDVGGSRTGGLHRTVSQRFFDKEGLDLPERIQTRIVMKEVGRPLETYSDSIELMAVTSQALIGHQQAWEKADILHRDVSVANILIDVNTSKGFLNDWDLCKYKEQLGTQAVPSQPGVSGTWAFSSAVSLMHPRKPKELADDLESFVHVPVYCLFRYHMHNYSSPLADTLKNAERSEQAADNKSNKMIAVNKYNYFYEEFSHTNGLYSGGDTKFDQIRIGTPPIKLAEQDIPAAKLLRGLFLLLQRHYKTIKFDDLRRYLADPQSPPRSLSQPIHDGNRAPQFINPFEGLDVNITFSSSDHSPTPSPSASSVSAGARPLDDHMAIMGVFHSVWKDANGRDLDVLPYRGDKLYDQFDDNTGTTSNDSTEPSESDEKSNEETASGSGTSSSRKRKSLGDPEPDLNPRPKRRAKRAAVK